MSLRLPRSNPNKKRGRRAKTPTRIEVGDNRGGSVELTPQELMDRLGSGLCFPRFRGKRGPETLVAFCAKYGYNPTTHPKWEHYTEICSRDCF